MDPIIYTHNEHNSLLVILSYIIATISAYASIDLARRVIVTKKGVRQAWLLLGAAVLGIGIWSMHFVAMLAHHFPEPVYYDTTIVIISVLFSILGCFLGFYIVSNKEFNLIRFSISGIMMGLGIVTMHYVGMAAIKPLTITYDGFLFSLSIIIAILASLAALWIGFLSPYTKMQMSWKLKLLFSLIMAIAITGMHYVGMAAATYSSSIEMNESIDSMIDVTLLAWIVAIATFFIFIVFFFTITFEQMWRARETVQNSILDAADDGIIVANNDGTIIHANPAFYRLTNKFAGDTSLYSLEQFHPDLAKDVTFNYDFLLDINSSTLEVKRYLIQDELLNKSLWFLRDITEKVRAEQKVEFMAYHDTLTKLPNRYKLNVDLDNWMQSGYEIACIYLDLDRLKFTNDTLGHQAGDILLKKVSQRLKDVVHENDLLSRVGGDEFIILLVDQRVDKAHDVANQCVEAMNVPFSINGINVRVTISAGVCLYPADASNAKELIQFADIAMYESKENGKNQVTSFNGKIQEQVRRKVQLTEGLFSAIDNKEFYLHYQSKVLLETGEIDGVEALLRWKHPVFGDVSPVEFIPIAEEKGLIFTIGEWVLQEACSQWVRWRDEGVMPITIAVNISPIQFSKEDFLYNIKQVIQKTKIDPHFLELEITESASLAFEKQTLTKLNELRHLGLKISLDDFGTGYSSFKHLKQLPIEVLKIDKSFIDQLIGNTGQEAIVRSMIQLGHNLNLKVLVEGVESQDQVDWLKNERCDFVQGFFYSRPVHQSEVKELLSFSALRV